jgi:hypothetical protein
MSNADVTIRMFDGAEAVLVRMDEEEWVSSTDLPWTNPETGEIPETYVYRRLNQALAKERARLLAVRIKSDGGPYR